jgi:phenylalanyl-tRNA synthetase beta chain
MKVSELWLREWVNPAKPIEEVCSMLTFAGLEVEEIAAVSEQFTNIVVGKILSIEKHPEADRLNVCTVDVGESAPLTIVCGAKNVKVGMKAPTALVGAILPNKKEITQSELRGVASYGMLCSITELGLAEQSEGLMQLPHDAPVGSLIWDYLKLNDNVIDVSITPNRGDCLSIQGLAKEISAVTQSNLHTPNLIEIKASIQDTFPVDCLATQDCPRYVGRIIKGVQADATTPMWMQERLRRAGIRCISPVVDVMNYVMLELGQPMHAFDLQTLAAGVTVRLAHANEELKLLDGQTVNLTPETLIIADKNKPLAIAGVMGGFDSAVTLLTQDVFLESAYFNPKAIARVTRSYGLGSDSSYRFERGIDPALQRVAIERATELLLEIAGGEPGPITEVIHAEYLPQSAKITLRKLRMEKLLGLSIPGVEVENIFSRLGFSTEKTEQGWVVTVPPRRSDITLEVDLIEELIRLYGYDKLPESEARSLMQLHARPETKVYLSTLRTIFRDLGFNEVVTYSFVDKKLQTLLNPEATAKALINPITADMDVMRTNLWPGLINTLLYNQNRQQSRVRLFEIGLRFILKDNKLEQQRVISGLISGAALPEQWSASKRDADFFDLKGDLQNVFKSTFMSDQFIFKAHQHPALHPGQTAEIYCDDKVIGVMGALHPSIAQNLSITDKVFMFELVLDHLETARLPRSQEISKFPEIRRDLAILVNDTIPAQRIQDTIKQVAGALLRDVNVFDVYQGKGIGVDQKSIALALILQHATRTLRDEEVADVVDRVIVALKDQFAAVLRS